MTHYPDYLDGKLDPQADALLTQIAGADAPSTGSLTVAEARATFLAPSWLGPGDASVSIRDILSQGAGGPLRLRLYTPRGKAPHPVLLFFHGGGFVLGTVEEFDPLCSRLSARTGAMVISVGYRLAPEHRCPAAIDDAEAAMRWVAGESCSVGADAGRVAVMGDSAGGNLAVAAAQVSRDEGLFALRLQVLLSPWVDLDDTRSESFRCFGGGRWLSTESIEWFRGHFLVEPSQARDARVSPLRAEDLSRLAPALIINAEFDVLRGQAAAFAERLKRSGVEVDYRLCRGMLHDFSILPGLFDRAAEVEEEIATALLRAFA